MQKNLFVPSQKLSILRPGLDPLIHLSGERLWEERHEVRRDGTLKKDESESPWLPISREQLAQGFWQGQRLRRVIITSPSGLGKTTCLKYLQVAMHAADPKRIVFRLDIQKLRISWRRLIPNLLQEELACPGNEEIPEAKLIDTMNRLRSSGRMVLLLDSLDQGGGETQFSNLVEICHRPYFENCPIILTTRPQALVSDRWQQLVPNPSAWHFIRIEEFEEREQRVLLGDRFDRVPESARTLLRVPRNIEYIKGLKIAQLERMETKSDIFASATKNLIVKGLKARGAKGFGRKTLDISVGKPTPKQVRLVEDVLAAVAFEMYFGPVIEAMENGSDKFVAPNLSVIDSHRGDEFFKRVLDRLKWAGIFPKQVTVRAFEGEIDRLSTLNTAITCDLFDEVISRDTIRWYDASLEEYFAALWVSRHCLPDDVPILKRCLVDPRSRETEAYAEFWRFACEMPLKVVTSIRGLQMTEHIQEELWVRAMSPQFEHAPAFRSTEMIYRAMMNVEQWKLMDHGASMITRWQSEYEAIKSDPSHPKYPIAQEIEEGFCRCPKEECDDSVPFWMGSPEDEPNSCPDEHPQILVQVTPFLMHRTTVTNAQYELFDPGHQNHRWIEFKNHPDGDDSGYSVVNVSWFDAYCFAAWTNSSLPTDVEWEYACRASPGKGKDESLPYMFGRECNSSMCNCTGGYWISPHPYSILHTLAATDDRYFRKTGAHPWGLLQMHGNVWEWCSKGHVIDSYEAFQHSKNGSSGSVSWELFFYARSDRQGILRGGSWGEQAQRCRSAYVLADLRDERCLKYGFRLSRRASTDRL